ISTANVVQISTTSDGLVVLSDATSSTGGPAGAIVSLYSVQPRGALAQRASAAIAQQARGGALASDGRFLYAATSEGIFGFDSQDETLSPLPGSAFNTQFVNCPVADPACYDNVTGLAVAPDRLFIADWVSRDGGALAVYSRSSN